MTSPSQQNAQQMFAEAKALHQAGRLQEAQQHYQAIISANPGHAEAMTMLGTAYLQQGRLEEGVEIIQRSLLLDDAQLPAHSSLGYALQALGRHQEALASCDRAITLRSDHPGLHYNRGNTLYSLQRHEDAIAAYDRAIALKLDYAEAHCNRGSALRALGLDEEALASYDRAIALRPDYAEAHSNRGNALHALGRDKEALASHDHAITLKPQQAEAHSNRGCALRALGRDAEALVSYDHAIALKPDYAEAYYNRGLALYALNRPAEAVESHDRAIALKPDHAEAHTNRGNALRLLGRPAEAVESHDRAIALKPDLAEAYWNKSLPLLMLGDYAQGWALYEWRWIGGDLRKYRRDFPQPLWLGDRPLAGRRLLVHAEQGFGDTLQFCRYLPMLEQLGAKVIFEVQPPLARLLGSLGDSIQLIPQGQPLPPFDLHCPLLSLPLAFRTTLDSIPADIPYLRADPAREAAWIRLLGVREQVRVGLAWSGAVQQGNNRNRSLPFSALEPLLTPEVEWHVLQKEIHPAEQAALPALDLYSHSPRLTDFSETAALIAQMDLVITVDTSVAHLAGAMGKPVWVMLSHAPDWRWLLERRDCPWYPTATLFRQPAPGDWTSVVAEVTSALGNQFVS